MSDVDVSSSPSPAGTGTGRGSPFMRPALEITIRLGLIALMLVWCFTIVRPFLEPILWGIIIAVASYPGYRRMEAGLGGRRYLAAAIFVVLALAVLILPTVMLADTVIGATGTAADALADGDIEVPPPPASVADWPIVGKRLYEYWSVANENLEEAFDKVAPQLRAIGSWLITVAAGAGFAIVKFVIAIIIAAVLLPNSNVGGSVADSVATRIAGPRGVEFAGLARDTVRNVARGILGVALIQAIFAGLVFLLFGIPGAGLLALVCLLLAVVQIGIFPVLIPLAIYVFSVEPTTTAILFVVCCLPVAVIDNILKPILLGRGAAVPMAVIFLGAIGGFISTGIIGLFIGAVVLSVGYTLFLAWMKEDVPTPEELAAPVRTAQEP